MTLTKPKALVSAGETKIREGERRVGRKRRRWALKKEFWWPLLSKREPREPNETGIRWRTEVMNGKQGSSRHNDKWTATWLEKDSDDPNRMAERTKSFPARKLLSEDADYAKTKELSKEAAINMRGECNQSNPYKSHKQKQSGARGVAWNKARCAWKAQIEAPRTIAGEAIITTRRKFFKPLDFRDVEGIDADLADISARDAAIEMRREWESHHHFN